VGYEVLLAGSADRSLLRFGGLLTLANNCAKHSQEHRDLQH